MHTYIHIYVNTHTHTHTKQVPHGVSSRVAVEKANEFATQILQLVEEQDRTLREEIKMTLAQLMQTISSAVQDFDRERQLMQQARAHTHILNVPLSTLVDRRVQIDIMCSSISLSLSFSVPPSFHSVYI